MTPIVKLALPEALRVLASLPLSVVVLEPGLRIASVNPAAEQFFGQSARRLHGMELREVLDVMSPHVSARLGDPDTPVSVREFMVAVRGGGVRRIDLNVAPLADSPGWQVLTIHDHTAVDALGDDSGGVDAAALRGPEIMAHEIKNPLAGIRGAAQLLARKADARDRALTELITGEVDRIADLIGRMQDLSRRTAPPVVPCNLHEAARRGIDVINAGRTGQEGFRGVREEFDPSLPPVLGSPDALVQVIINLLSNALEACSLRSDPEVKVRTRFASGLQLHRSEDGAPVRLPVELRVTDNGSGVPPSLREHIFEPFVTSKKSGQGLGLPLVRKLVREMNGRITHERDEEAGLTHFRIHLPLAMETRKNNRDENSLGGSPP